MSDTPAIPSHRATLKALLHTNDRFMNILAAAGIQSVRDFLQYLPRTYQDRSNLTLLRDLDTESNEVQSVIGQIIAKKQLPRGAKKLYEIEFHDVVGDVGYITFFNTYFPTKALVVGSRYIITGKAKYDYKKYIFSHPQSIPTDVPDDGLIDAMKEKIQRINKESDNKMGIFNDDKEETPGSSSRDDAKQTNDMLSSLTPEIAQVGRIYPIYPELQGIKADRWAKNMRKLLPLIPDHFAEYLPGEFLEKFSLMGVQDMIHTLHFPPSMDAVRYAQHRLFFDRLLRIQLHSLIKKQQYITMYTQSSANRGESSPLSEGMSVGQGSKYKHNEIISEDTERIQKRSTIELDKESVQKRGLMRDGLHLPYNPLNRERGNTLRKVMTKAEKKLWFDFFAQQESILCRRQRLIDHYIVDFYIAAVGLAIELDGDTHNTEEQQAYDEERTKLLELYSIHVIRFTNEQIYNNFAEVCDEIIRVYEELKKKYSSNQLPTPSSSISYPLSYGHLPERENTPLKDSSKDVLSADSLPIREGGGMGNRQSKAPDYSLISSLTTLLPFTLTTAQKRVVKELIDDMHLDKPMMRLLQGDVGSGKTVVAAIAAYYTIKKRGGQAVFLAPLSILAQQHHRSLAKLLLPLGLRVELLSGSRTASEKADIKKKLADGQIDVVVGTHAILQEDVSFHHLTLAVVDEQHKFGVRQRGFFSQHGHPHIIQMSATPIPRSMALAFFGEFDVSIIDELPAGRKPITTKVITRSDRLKLKPWILDKITLGQKVFFVAPLIEESDKLEEVHNVTTLYEEVCEMFAQTEAKIGLMHGKMKSRDKDEVMHSFKTGKINILVSTTVIEVGVDIPEATIMVIKNSERFGLAQLHQLRGRIGRSDLQSYCFLETKTRSGDSYQRIKVLEETNDGFKLAQIDLQHRGTGEILGTRQSGESDIPIEILGDLRFIEQVRQGAERLLEKYPHLDGLPGLQKYLHEKLGGILH